MPTQKELMIADLGERAYESPLARTRDSGFVDDRTRVRYAIEFGERELADELSFEKAGARQRIFFDPAPSSARPATSLRPTTACAGCSAFPTATGG
jgi:hypothetical protein